jgi:hypothetical protein
MTRLTLILLGIIGDYLLMGKFYENKEISPKKLQARTFENLNIYDEKSFFEMYTLYLGKSQLFDQALKKLLVDLYGIKFDMLERKTLGQTIRLLEKNRLRSDYLILLKNVLDDRNHATHEMLANKVISGSSEIEFSERFQRKELLSAAFNLEQSIILFDYFQKHKAWRIEL